MQGINDGMGVMIAKVFSIQSNRTVRSNVGTVSSSTLNFLLLN